MPAGVFGRCATNGAARVCVLIAVDAFLQPGLDAVRAELVATVQLRPRLDNALWISEADRIMTYRAFLWGFRGGVFLILLFRRDVVLGL